MNAVCLQMFQTDRAGQLVMQVFGPHAGAPVETPQSTTSVVWLAEFSEAIAAKVFDHLRNLNVSVRVCPTQQLSYANESQHGFAQAGDTPDKDSRLDSLSPNEKGELSCWRGGLAPGALRRVKHHVESQLYDRIDVADLAKLVGLSECHFSRAFRQSVGVPPHRYILSRRIEEATRLIKGSDCALSEIAVTIGFSDQSHFTRTFVRFTGETPRAFRHRHR